VVQYLQASLALSLCHPHATKNLSTRCGATASCLNTSLPAYGEELVARGEEEEGASLWAMDAREPTPRTVPP
jgi:hypothetical protein